MRLQIVKRSEDPPKWLPIATSLGAVVLAFVISGGILAAVGADPLQIYRYFFRSAFGSWGAFSDVMVKATPLILIGLGCALAFRMKLWNIGAEGQFYIGAFFSSMVVMVPLVDVNTTPPIVTIGLMMLLGIFGGALYGFIPGLLKAKFGINEIITTLMLNYVAVFGTTTDLWQVERCRLSDDAYLPPAGMAAAPGRPGQTEPVFLRHDPACGRNFWADRGGGIVVHHQ